MKRSSRRSVVDRIRTSPLMLGTVLLVACSRATPPAESEGGTSSGAGGASTVGTTDAAGTTGAAGTTDAAGAAGATGGTSAAGTTGTAGTTNTAGAAGTDAGISHLSAGCGRHAPVGDVPGSFATHIVDVNGIDPIYLPGGQFAQQSGPFTFAHRPFSVRLPTPYDETQGHTVIFGAGGCGSFADSFAMRPQDEYVVDTQHTSIEVGLSDIGPCFADGGPSIGDRTDTPDLPYFRAALAAVEEQFCVDTNKVFVTGYSSGAWEAQTLGCAAADVIKGIGTVGGGMRAHRPKCAGPMPAILIISTGESQLGPLDPTDPAFISSDSAGALPMRDELLARNGCVGTTTWPLPSPFSSCVRFTGCPATAPVVWCLLGQGRNPYGNYSPGPILGFLSTLQ